MGLLEKMGLVERESTIDAANYPVFVEPETEVEAHVESTVDVVDTIYCQNDLSNRADSIYTIKALIDTLPSEMTTAKKQATVSGILQVSGKSVAALLADAENRKCVLAAASTKIIQERHDEIATANADIEELKHAIEAATIKIKEAEDIISATSQSVTDELKAIDALVDFCNGMEGVTCNS